MQPFSKIAAITALALSLGSPAFAQADRPDATATFSGGSVAAGIGYSWGKGTLNFQGKSYPFSVSGLSVVDVGISRIEGNATIYNLQKIEDFAGNYVAAGAGATLAGGGSVAVMQNQNGVIAHFISTTAGLKLSLSANGISVKLD